MDRLGNVVTMSRVLDEGATSRSSCRASDRVEDVRFEHIDPSDFGRDAWITVSYRIPEFRFRSTAASSSQAR